jgi:methylmalonyl-CoA mutase C-terminal domain/subunit
MANARVVIGMLGLDQHELGAIAVARMLRDAGMEVVYAGRFNTPESIVQIALDEDADVIGISCHSWEYVEYVPELMKLVAEKDADVSVVLGGSVITPADASRMKQQGVAAVFGPGAESADIVGTLADLAGARQARVSMG